MKFVEEALWIKEQLDFLFPNEEHNVWIIYQNLEREGDFFREVYHNALMAIVEHKKKNSSV